MSAPRPIRSGELFRQLVGIYVQGSVAAVLVVMFLVWLGLEFNAAQWTYILIALPLAVLFYVLPDIYLLRRHSQPLREVLDRLERGEKPSAEESSRAIVRALNLPYYSFLRVVLFHGPAATLTVPITTWVGNTFFHGHFTLWQMVTFATIVFFFASPTHAIFEYFAVARRLGSLMEWLFPLVGTLERERQAELRRVDLRKKLLYLAVAVTSLPLLFLAGSVTFKVSLLLARVDAHPSTQQMSDFLVWVYGVAALCMTGAVIMSVLTAAEVSRSAARLRAAMNRVERGDLEVQLQLTSTDEYADLFRGFNLMTEGLREEVQILAVSQDLMGELHLDLLLERIIHATTALLDADRSTLFLYDEKAHELWSRFAEGLASREIRIPTGQGIAGSVFTTGKTENIANASQDARFNPEVDRRTGYHTQSILAMPVINKAGKRIGVTQVLNKRGGPFTAKDESRLRALTAQIAIALENAKLFDDVLRVQNYNESILRSTSNSMITLDGEGKVVTANAATSSLLKVDADSILGVPAEKLFAPPNDWVLASLANVTATGTNDLVVDASLRLANGEIASVNLTSVPLLDANLLKIGSMLILEDITDEKRVKSTMSRYMSKEVVQQLLESGETELGGQVQRVTVLFSDIRDFTTVSESIGARETVSMLNEYFELMVDVIFKHRGILDKYIGDALMALFGAPFNGPEDADNAVRVANSMVTTLRVLNGDRRAKGQRPIEIGIGVNTDEVVIGSIGSPKRMEYTAIGDGVNLASRLEGACKMYGTKVLLSEFTVRALTQPGRLREVDLMCVKGKHQPVAIYEALDHHTPETFPNLEQAIELFGQGVAAYRRRDWLGAARYFEGALAQHPQDAPSRIYRDRCRHFAAQPPEEDWDGVWVLKEK